MRDVRAYEARTQRLAVWVCLLVVLFLLEPARSVVLGWLDAFRHGRRSGQEPPETPEGAVRVPGGAVWALPEHPTKPARAPRQRGTQP